MVYCNRFCKTERKGSLSLKKHLEAPRASIYGCSSTPASGRKYGLATRVVARQHHLEAQAELEVVRMGDTDLEYVFDFGYLGRNFESSGETVQDMFVSIGRAGGVFKKLIHVWKSSHVSDAAKIRLYKASVLSVMVCHCQSWHLYDAAKKRLNHFNNRSCFTMLGTDFGTKPPVDLVAMIRAQRHNWIGKVLRYDDSRLPKQSYTRFVQPYAKGSVFEDVLAHSSMDELIAAAADKQEWTRRTNEVILGKPKHVPTKANTAEETKALLDALPIGAILMYTDGGCDGNGARGIYGKAGWGLSIRKKINNWTSETLAELWGPVVVTKDNSPYCEGATAGTNNTGELIAMIQGMIWLGKYGGDYENVAVCFDSMYASNMLQGVWTPQLNLVLVKTGKDLVAKETECRSSLSFVHVKGHSSDGGNDRADELVQWGKEPAPYCRLQLGGEGEGESLQGPAKRASLLGPPPNACLTSEFFTEMVAWQAKKARLAMDLRSTLQQGRVRTNSYGEIIVNHLNVSDDNEQTAGAATPSTRDRSQSRALLQTVLTGQTCSPPSQLIRHWAAIPGMPIQNAAAIAEADGNTPDSSVSLDLPTTEEGLGLRISAEIEVHTAHSPEGATEDEGVTGDSHNAYTHALSNTVTSSTK